MSLIKPLFSMAIVASSILVVPQMASAATTGSLAKPAVISCNDPSIRNTAACKVASKPAPTPVPQKVVGCQASMSSTGKCLDKTPPAPIIKQVSVPVPAQPVCTTIYKTVKGILTGQKVCK